MRESRLRPGFLRLGLAQSDGEAAQTRAGCRCLPVRQRSARRLGRAADRVADLLWEGLQPRRFRLRPLRKIAAADRKASGLKALSQRLMWERLLPRRFRRRSLRKIAAAERKASRLKALPQAACLRAFPPARWRRFSRAANPRRTPHAGPRRPRAAHRCARAAPALPARRSDRPPANPAGRGRAGAACGRLRNWPGS